MAKQNPRIALTVKPDLNKVLDDISELQRIPKSVFIVQMLNEMYPTLVALKEAFQSVKDKQNPSLILNKMAAQSIANLGNELNAFYENDQK